ncbi:hypothetical protein DSECCO2_661080 [anaerobic digester metagenome]
MSSNCIFLLISASGLESEFESAKPPNTAPISNKRYILIIAAIMLDASALSSDCLEKYGMFAMAIILPSALKSGA